jgi:hypothetical protein
VECPASPQHGLFYRRLIVEGMAKEYIEHDMSRMEFKEPAEYRLVYRLRGVFCALCKTEATVKLVS